MRESNACRGEGNRGCRCLSGCHLRASVRGVRVPRLGLGYLVKRTVRFVGLGLPAGARELNTPMPQQYPSQTPIGRARLNPFGKSNAGGRSESRARSYAANPGSRDGTLQVSRAGNAGKSLTTPSSIRPRLMLTQGFHAPVHKVLPFFDLKSKRSSGAGDLPPPCFSPWGMGSAPWVGSPCEAHRALLWVRGSPAAGEG